MRDYLISTIQKTFEVGFEQSEKLYHELLQCTHNKNLVSNQKHFFLFLLNKNFFLDNSISNTRKARRRS